MKLLTFVGLPIAGVLALVCPPFLSELENPLLSCRNVGEKCTEFRYCCEGLTCTGAPFKRSCEEKDIGCTLEGRECSDLTKCCEGLTCQGQAFLRTCMFS